MPSRDPTTGKALSGAQKRKRAAEAATADYEVRASARKPAPPPVRETAAPPVPRTRPLAAADFDRLPPPPIDDPATAIAWTNNVLLIALDQVLRDPDLKNPERWRWIKEFGGTLGHLRDKSAEQAAIKKAMAAQAAATKTAGTVDARGRAKAPVPRPSS